VPGAIKLCSYHIHCTNRYAHLSAPNWGHRGQAFELGEVAYVTSWPNRTATELLNVAPYTSTDSIKMRGI